MLIYTGILLAIVLAVLFSLVTRVPLKVDVIRDRASISREVEGGQIENVFRLQIMNTTERPRRFVLRADGLPTLSIAGSDRFELEAAGTRLVTVKARVQPGAVAAGTHKIRFVVEAEDDAHVAVTEKSVFVVRQ